MSEFRISIIKNATDTLVATYWLVDESKPEGGDVCQPFT
jgi:autonomous glycyl radical cofactor GrcA